MTNELTDFYMRNWKYEKVNETDAEITVTVDYKSCIYIISYLHPFDGDLETLSTEVHEDIEKATQDGTFYKLLESEPEEQGDWNGFNEVRHGQSPSRYGKCEA